MCILCATRGVWEHSDLGHSPFPLLCREQASPPGFSSSRHTSKAHPTLLELQAAALLPVASLLPINPWAGCSLCACKAQGLVQKPWLFLSSWFSAYHSLPWFLLSGAGSPLLNPQAKALHVPFQPSSSPEELQTWILMGAESLAPCTHWIISQQMHRGSDGDLQPLPSLSGSNCHISGSSNGTQIAQIPQIVPEHKLNRLFFKFTLIQRPAASCQAGRDWLWKRRRKE